ncbi:MAG: TraR/DksA C4-type zinc finger protein [Nitrospirota bacterium]|nr:MAG: hypothetical protein A2132_02855 [Nitrospirae bacterium RBG_16_43_11]
MAAEKNRTDKYDEIRIDLEKQRAALLSEAGVLIGSGLNPDKINFPDVTDQASAEEEKNFSIRLRERERKLLKKIDEAIERIAKGTFGVCDGCGEDVGYNRLQARPVTTYCIECKTQQEEDEKQRE